MWKYIIKTAILLTIIIVVSSTYSCRKIEQIQDNNPEINVLKEGFKASAAVGYCASLANMAFRGAELPSNVRFVESSSSEYSGFGLIYVSVSNANPLPFNSNIGDIVIAAIGNKEDHSGVMSILFADIDLLNAQFEFYGIRTVPFIENENGDVITVFANQDIVIGSGDDTIMNLSLTRPMFNLELERANEPYPTSTFAAIKQNVWFVKIDQNNTYNNIYDDKYEINGGGQLAEVRDESGGVQYHALIETRFNYANCRSNPTYGVGFIQNIKAGNGIDLGNITLDFHPNCDGQAYASFATGKYITYIGKNVNLHFE
jgi:hypothetical protein